MLKILCIVQLTVPSTQISIIIPFKYLEEQQQIRWQLVKEAAFKAELLDQANVVVFQRNCHPKCRPILDAVKAKSVPMIYEIDDNYFEIPVELPIGRYMRIPTVVNMIESLLRSADIVKIGSLELAPLVAKYNSSMIFQPYSVDLSILDQISPCENSSFTIGYAGTINHQIDFNFVISAILRISKEYPQIHWDFVGCFPEGIDDIPNHSFTPFIPDYASFLQELYRRNWQIGLCPVLDLPHNRCKTDNKLREYSACRIAGIFSDIPPYSNNVRHGETGLLAVNNEASWFNAMKQLIDDDTLRNQIANQAHQWVAEERSVPVIAQQWWELFNKVLLLHR